MTEEIKAVALISGGLDSFLAARLMLDQGLEVIGLSCKHPFHAITRPEEKSYPQKAADALGIELVRPDVTDTIINLVKHPPHGHGKHLNPCIDCRLMYLKQGEILMKERGAKFLVTGEVLGQRPMSQRKDTLNAILRDSGLKGLILRPLCAKLLEPTIPEKEGWVDREKLLAISGRGRNRQMELAAKYGFSDYSAPAGGCLLTMEDFVRKVEYLLETRPDFGRAEIEFIKRGRHFALSDSAMIALGKDDADNQALDALAQDGDFIITTPETPGPLCLVRGKPSEVDLDAAMSIMGRYMKKLTPETLFEVRDKKGALVRTGTAPALDPFEAEKMRI